MHTSVTQEEHVLERSTCNRFYNFLINTIFTCLISECAELFNLVNKIHVYSEWPEINHPFCIIICF